MIGKSNSKIFFEGKKPTKFWFYLITVLGWIYLIVSVGIIFWISEYSEISWYYKFGIVTILIVFGPSIQDLFKSYPSFIEENYESDHNKDISQ